MWTYLSEQTKHILLLIALSGVFHYWERNIRDGENDDGFISIGNGTLPSKDILLLIVPSGTFRYWERNVTDDGNDVAS